MTEDVEPNWLPLDVVTALNEARASEQGDDADVKDACALQTALARPLDAHAYGERDLFALAAMYGAGIITRNPFSSANRQTGWGVVVKFLSDNGVGLTASQSAIDAMLAAIASGEMDETGFSDRLRAMAD